MPKRTLAKFVFPAVLSAAIAFAGAAASCGTSSPPGATPDGGSDPDTSADVTRSDRGLTGEPDASVYACDGCAPFPVGMTECAPSALAEATIVYPTDNVLLPPNLNVFEVQFVPPAGATQFEVTFTNSITNLHYDTPCVPVPDARGGPSKGCGVTLSQAAWDELAFKNRQFEPLQLSVRATKDGSCVSTSKAILRVFFAETDITGGVYYWQSSSFGGVYGKAGGLYEHDFESANPAAVPVYTTGANGTCVGCHNLSPDGLRMTLATHSPDGTDSFANTKTHVMNVPARTIIGGATMSPGFQTFTRDHTRIIASSFGTAASNSGFDVFDGDGNFIATVSMQDKVTQPSLARDDRTLVYVAPQIGTISAKGDHHFMGGSIYTSLFDLTRTTIGSQTLVVHAPNSSLDGGAGGRSFFYPSIAPTGAFILFNEAPTDDAFFNKNARVKLVHYPTNTGDPPIDLPALNGAQGQTNSWPRFAPTLQIYRGHKLLWVTFSSNRDYGLHLTGNAGLPNCYPPDSPPYDQPQPAGGLEGCAQPQIWMAGVIVDEPRNIDLDDRSFAAFWLPFQDVTTHNHSAQWVDKVRAQPSGACGQPNDACSAQTLCCSDSVCCNGTCAVTCVR